MPDHVHQRHHGPAQGRGARAALPPRPGASGRALARRPARRPRVVHGRHRVVEVGPQRVHRALDSRRERTPARCAVRSRAAARAACRRARQRPVHGPHRVSGHRQARRPDAGAGAADAGRGGRGAQPRGSAHVSRRHRDRDPRRLRADRDRPAHRDADRRARQAGVDGAAASGRRPAGDRRRARAGRPAHRPDVLRRPPRRRRRAG